jgi:hypothetical protein
MLPGINDKSIEEHKTYFFSIGHRCSSSSILRLLKLKTESYPFDWIVSNLSTVRSCIQNDFVEFLRPENYKTQNSVTGNQMDGKVNIVCDENPEVNRVYLDMGHGHIGNRKQLNGVPYTYWLPLALTHHSMLDTKNHEYFERCVSRFWQRMESGYWEKKRYLYIHPYIGVYEYDFYKHDLKKEWQEFSRFMARKMGDIRGVFIVPVFIDKGMECRDIIWEELFRTQWAVGWKVEISNWKFTDAGETFSGDYEQELRNIEARVRLEFMEDLPDKKMRADLDKMVLVEEGGNGRNSEKGK